MTTTTSIYEINVPEQVFNEISVGDSPRIFLNKFNIRLIKYGSIKDFGEYEKILPKILVPRLTQELLIALLTNGWEFIDLEQLNQPSNLIKEPKEVSDDQINKEKEEEEVDILSNMLISEKDNDKKMMIIILCPVFKEDDKIGKISMDTQVEIENFTFKTLAPIRHKNKNWFFLYVDVDNDKFIREINLEIFNGFTIKHQQLLKEKKWKTTTSSLEINVVDKDILNKTFIYPIFINNSHFFIEWFEKLSNDKESINNKNDKIKEHILDLFDSHSADSNKITEKFFQTAFKSIIKMIDHLFLQDHLSKFIERVGLSDDIQIIDTSIDMKQKRSNDLFETHIKEKESSSGGDIQILFDSTKILLEKMYFLINKSFKSTYAFKKKKIITGYVCDSFESSLLLSMQHVIVHMIVDLLYYAKFGFKKPSTLSKEAYEEFRYKQYDKTHSTLWIDIAIRFFGVYFVAEQEYFLNLEKSFIEKNYYHLLLSYMPLF